MPKIVMKVDRKAHTRSQTQGERVKSEGTDAKSPKRRSTTPVKSAKETDSKPNISRIHKSGVKLADRKFFTVHEDNLIIQYFKVHEATKTSRNIAEDLAKKVKHSVESIRDRIKRFLSHLRASDEKYIAEEAKVLWKLPQFPPRFRS